MYSNLTSLFDHSVKRYGIITAVVAVAIDLATYFTGDFHPDLFRNHILLHYISLISLTAAVTSKDKLDDELSKQIRYSVFKNTLTFSVVLFGILTMILSVYEVTSISTLTILYILEGMLAMHLILYHIGHRFSPKWLLEERTAPERYNRIMKVFMIGMLIVVFLLTAISILAEITGEV